MSAQPSKATPAQARVEQAGLKPYDLVALTLGDGRNYQGRLMPRHSFSAPDILVLKLANGYNLGLAVDERTGFKLLERAPEEVRLGPKCADVVADPDLPWLTVLSTGGTIAAHVDYSTGAVHPALTADDLATAVEGLATIANLRCEAVFSLLSEDLTPAHWVQLAEKVAASQQAHSEGLMVAHGTDTLSYTAAALAFQLPGLVAPVVLVGSQRSSDRPSSDARLNLLGAARAAVAPVGEVLVAMHATTSDTAVALHRGVRVRKLHTSARDAFRSVNEPPLGQVTAQGELVWRAPPAQAPPAPAPLPAAKKAGRSASRAGLLRSGSLRSPLAATARGAAWEGPHPAAEAVEARIGLEPRVALWHYAPGHTAEDLLRAAEGKRGLVIAGTGLGHIGSPLIPAVAELVEGGTHVVAASQCLFGRVNLKVYSNGRALLRAGVIPAEDMLPEVAYVKLMWTLAHAEDAAATDTGPEGEVRRIMTTNLVGEIGSRRGQEWWDSLSTER